MPLLKYKDPADGLWKPVPVGGSSTAPNEVAVDPVQPTDPEVELWLDVDEPATGGGLDQAAADDLYVNVTGDAMAGPLVVQTPTAMAHAAQWMDAVPRFADATERDAAIPAPARGQTCFIGAPGAGALQMYDVPSEGWKYIAGGNIPASLISFPSGTLLGGDNILKGGAPLLQGGITYNPATGDFAVPQSGFYSVTGYCHVTAVATGWQLRVASAGATLGYSATTTQQPFDMWGQIVWSGFLSKGGGIYLVLSAFSSSLDFWAENQFSIQLLH